MSEGPRVWLLWGKDRGAIQARLAELRASVLQPEGVSNGMEAFNHERFDAAYTEEIKAVLGACRQMPVAAPARLVELASPEDWAAQRGIDSKKRERLRELAIAGLLEYFAEPSPSTVLVVTSTGLTKASKLVKAASAAPEARVEHHAPPTEESARDEVLALARAAGVRIDSGAAALLVERLGVGRAELEAGLQRARSHAEGPAITLEDVDAVAADHREFDVFRIVDAVGQGDHEVALTELARAFEGTPADFGNAMRIFAMLLRQLRITFAAHAGGERAAAGYGVPAGAARRAVQNARRFDEARLRRAYGALARIDAAYKGAGPGRKVAARDPALLLQRWVLEVCDALPGVAPE